MRGFVKLSSSCWRPHLSYKTAHVVRVRGCWQSKPATVFDQGTCLRWREASRLKSSLKVSVSLQKASSSSCLVMLEVLEVLEVSSPSKVDSIASLGVLVLLAILSYSRSTPAANRAARSSSLGVTEVRRQAKIDRQSIRLPTLAPA